MAKVTAPFLSLGAVGSVAGTLTASVWKGIKTMRQKSNPANPNTAAQQAQRTKMSDAVQFWRRFISNTATKTAWNLSASVSGKPMSGFNAYTKEAIAALAATSAAVMESAFTVPTTTASGVIPAGDCLTVSGGVSSATGVTGLKVLWGSSSNDLLSEATMQFDAGGVWGPFSAIDTGLSAGDKAYFQLVGTQGGSQFALSGIMEITLT